MDFFFLFFEGNCGVVEMMGSPTFAGDWRAKSSCNGIVGRIWTELGLMIEGCGKEMGFMPRKNW